MSLFVNNTKRSASELLADLSACRQLRHLNDGMQQAAIAATQAWVATNWLGHKAIKHPNPNNLCVQCGNPRSKFSIGEGLCVRCFTSDGAAARDLWVEDVFDFALKMYGFSCDACNEIEGVVEEERRAAVVQILASGDYSVKPVLCGSCSQAFKAYTSQHFGRGAWRRAKPRDLEKMTLAWFAMKVKLLAEKVSRQANSASGSPA